MDKYIAERIRREQQQATVDALAAMNVKLDRILAKLDPESAALAEGTEPSRAKKGKAS
jgi:hypothetical protein